MINKNTQIRVGVLALGALALLALFILDMRRLSSENAEIVRLLTEYAEIESEESAVHSIKSLKASSAADIEALEALALNDERIVPLIESIEEAGRVLELELKIVSVDKDKEDASPQLIRIVIEASGTWDSAFALTQAVESLPHRVMIESVSLTKMENVWRERISISLNSFK